MPVVLEAKNLTKRYGDVIAVDKVSLSVEKGSLFGLQGPLTRYTAETDVHAGLHPRAVACVDRRAPDQLRPNHAGRCQGLPRGICQKGQDYLYLNPHPRACRGDLLGVCDPSQGHATLY